jgi:hypothetical protein
MRSAVVTPTQTNRMNPLKRITLALPLAATLALTQTAGAQTAVTSKTDSKQVAPAQKKSISDLFNLGHLYRDDTNPFLEEFDLTGRLQADFYHSGATTGTPSKYREADFFEFRRFRIGEDAWLADRHVELKADLDTNLQSRHAQRDFYNRMTNLFVGIVIDDAFKLKIGKQEPHFGYDREVSDTLQPFFERSFFDDQVFSNPPNDYVTGATAYGNFGHIGYAASIYSPNVNKELGTFNGGQGYLGEINYDLKSVLKCDKALWTLDYLNVEGLSAHSNVFNTTRNAVATYLDYKQGRAGLVTQFGYLNGIATKGDVYQLLLMPTYDLTDKLQAEFR